MGSWFIFWQKHISEHLILFFFFSMDLQKEVKLWSLPDWIDNYSLQNAI